MNVASAWLLSSGGHHHHAHSYGHAHDDHHEHEEEHRILTPDGTVLLTVFETNHPPVFRLRRAEGGTPASASVIHVIADAAVSVLVIAGLLMAWAFGWLWMDPLAGIVGAVVIASWAYGLVRDTGAILLDMNPDRGDDRECPKGHRGPRRPAH